MNIHNYAMQLSDLRMKSPLTSNIINCNTECSLDSWRRCKPKRVRSIKDSNEQQLTVTVKFWGQSFSRGHYISPDIPASRVGVYLLDNPANNFSRRTHVDRSCILCGFFGFLCAELSTSFLISPSLVLSFSIAD